jgi:DNA-binding NarL/FixJ family response regulator
MVEDSLIVMVALSDPERAEELLHALAENDGMTVVVPSELEQPDDIDVIVTDSELLDGATPHVALGVGAAGANIHAVLPAAASTSLVSAAVTIAAAGYRLLPAQSGHADSLHRPTIEGPDGHLHTALTPREMETLALLADGASNKVIARQLKISVHTAKFHVAAVLTKLHAQNRADAVAIGLRQGLLYV